MPPANTPSQSPPVTAAQSPYLEQLALLASPVPDLASTLTTQAEQDEANDANVSFLRTTVNQAPAEPTSGTIDDLRQLRQRIRADRETRLHDTNDTESQRRMRRAIMSVNRRYNPSELDESANPQISSRLDPSWSSQPSYQGWAPSRGSYGNEAQGSTSSSNTRTSSTTTTDEQRRAQFMAMRQHQVQLSSASPGNESSLRTAALLQSVRRNAQLSARSRSHLQNYILDREVVGEISPRTERQLGIGYPSSTPPARQLNRDSHTPNENVRPRADSWADLPQLQSRLLGDGKYHVDDAIQYLERLRFCESYQDSLSSAIAGGFVRHEFFIDNNDDFILDTLMIEPPAESSWLKVGSVFSGSQHAPEQSVQIIHNRTESRNGLSLDHTTSASRPTNRHAYSYNHRSASSSLPRPPHDTTTVNSENLDPRFRTTPLNSAAERSLRQSSLSVPAEDRWPNRWPVKVNVHSVDYNTMTLTGTMAAYNVPDKSSPSRESSITTFLEGEIIDFNKHTLDTKSYTTAKDSDGKNWARLEPFKALDEEEIVRGLVSRRWMREELGAKYILMRWKEKCFVDPSDAESALTISGFYYVSLRRSDGHIEGLYYDPSSTPFQHLTLDPEGRKCFPAYQFT
ncbi:MAG: hypothetical protein LQ351_006415 [Letrouitia transgressa]|nr:MAG: hypothetical protein LQ351_006415 [Letrouitia transgressa]